jgi:hypothetical protein
MENLNPEKKMAEEPTTFDVDEVLTGNVAEATKKVGVAFGDDNEPTVGFIIVGKDAPPVREAAAKMRAAGIKRQANKRTRIDTKTEDGALAFAEILEENEFELAIAATVGWFGFTRGKEALPFDAGVLRQMFIKRPSWRERVSAAMETDEGFLKLSSTTSAISRAANSEEVEREAMA